MLFNFSGLCPIESRKKAPSLASIPTSNNDSERWNAALLGPSQMTIRKKVVRSDDEVEVYESEVNNPLLRALVSKVGFRVIAMILLASMHPVGRQLLGTFGFEFPDTKKITVAAEEAKASKTELTALSDSVKELRSDVQSIKSNNAVINAKVDNMDQTFRGFQIDWAKWKSDKKIEP